MTKRRAHRKSRGGCAECKRRHIKCGEEKPSCLHCIRYNIPCIYRQALTAASDVVSAEDSSPQSDPSWQSIGLDDYIDGSPGVISATTGASKDLFKMKDMALLHHWITVAGYSILNTHELDYYWHSVIPSIGFNHQYVMHSILSLSALHLVHSSPSDRGSSLLVATEHRSKALDGFTEDLRNVGPSNSSALFANAMLTFFYAFVSFSKTFDDVCANTKVRTAHILGAEWILLVRGTADVLEPVYDHVREGPLRSFLDLHNFDNLDPTDSVHTSAFSKRLVEINNIWAADEHAEVYNETLHILRRCSVWMEQFGTMQDGVEVSWGYNRFYSGPFIWLFSAPRKYFVLQQQRQPPALIIFAYYGTLLHRLNSYWWAEGCGQSIVSTVHGCLGPYWSSWIDWPKQAVGLPCPCA
ncbi:hypothetical protein BU25DRAFT_343901 [Macroventuria anomochaeta]|uniref:Uncharacterized protein n=1 Tax=Macroventuria anomochaeta TaxID=301207 RepID=A0ACB6RXK6_9PLEO|nr:uncharacterized protein BU25DRAFT_343901 [Macroventuria anomochaeta]KAF2626508.1 hypothetical protein BU25DRAFT_343901 [Macroventuria anomochaeta]